MSSTLTREVTLADVLASVRRLEGAIATWERSAAPINWRGQPVFDLAAAAPVQAAALDLFRLTNTPDVDPAARPLVLALDAFRDVWLAWQGSPPLSVDPCGGAAVWGPWAAVLEAARRKQGRRAGESVADLVAQGVAPEQIAKMQGWYRDGQPDTDRVLEEIASPGRHTAADEAAAGNLERAWRERSLLPEGVLPAEPVGDPDPEVEAAAEPPAAPPPQATSRPAPELLDDLIRQGVSVRQISKMKRISEEEVRARAAAMGQPTYAGHPMVRPFQTTPAMRLEREAAGEARLQEILDLAEFHRYLELPARNDRIRALLLEGHRPAFVLRLLAPLHPELTLAVIETVGPQPGGKDGENLPRPRMTERDFLAITLLKLDRAVQARAGQELHSLEVLAAAAELRDELQRAKGSTEVQILALDVAPLVQSLEAFGQRRPEATDGQVRQRLSAAMEALRDSLRRVRFFDFAVLDQLGPRDQEESLRWIAQLHRWAIPDGSPDVAKVIHVIDRPGAHRCDVNWSDPALIDLANRAEAAWRQSRSTTPAA